ncbi:MAG: hypothetical protein JW809_18020 [Pirellulales bacterium]|nr:hypothetical protein [Pirellulales bacterium]
MNAVPEPASSVAATPGKRRRWRRRLAVLAVAMLVAVLAAWGYRWSQRRPLLVEPTDFPLRPVALFESVPRGGWASFLFRGHCRGADSLPGDRDPDTRYPELASDRPLFGVLFGRGQDHFGVLFGAGAYRPGEAPDEDGLAAMAFVVDESGGPGAGYDRLFLDLDRDSDLADEEPLRLWKNHPALPKRMTGKGCVIFEPFRTERLRRGEEAGESAPAGEPATMELVPRLEIPEFFLDPAQAAEFERPIFGSLFFIPTEARAGTIQIGRSLYDFYCAQEQGLNGRYSARTIEAVARRRDEWPFAQLRNCNLGQWNFVDGLDYRLSISPEGDRLRVAPYEGAYGTFEIVLDGAEKVDKLEIDVAWEGEEISMGSEGRACSVSLGPQARWSCRVPAGEYKCRAFFDVVSDGVSLKLWRGLPGQMLRDSPEPYDWRGDPVVVRPGETTVWTAPLLSAKPSVYFERHPKDMILAPGETAFLIPSVVLPEVGYEMGWIRGVAALPLLTLWDASGQVVASQTLEYG